MKKRLIFILSFFVLTAVHAENDKAFVWEVSSESNTVYLMGSIHVADNSFYPLRKEIEDAFNRSSHLVVELDVNKIDHDAYNQILLEKGSYKNGKTIEDVLSEETWLQLRQSLKKLNINYDAVKNYKPGILVLTLSAIQVIQMGFDPALGIDVYFLQKATQQSEKKVVELETLQQQLDLFIDMPDGDLLLKESLYSLDESESLMADMVRYWKRGDEVKMNKLLFEDALDEYPAFGEIYDELFYERNRQMTIKIDEMLKQQEDYFVVVGTGHLIGEKGIVNALKEKGYKVKRL
ncbi:MAG: TraB/GumN family protein [Gammaproteobacteria bacterium]|nr:TraB/GumN family protein [Gammaproteobacteria bacterium]